MLPHVMDRAGVLEMASQEEFDDVYGTSRKTSPLSGPLQMVAPSPDSWTPLLFLSHLYRHRPARDFNAHKNC